MWLKLQLEGDTDHALPVCPHSLPPARTDRLTACRGVSALQCLTLAAAQVLDLDALLLLTGRLLHLAGVVVGMAVRGAHRVEADVAAVDVANAPKGEDIRVEM